MPEFNFGFGLDKNAHIAQNLAELVGNTPLLKMSRFSKVMGCSCDIIAKLEYFNPLGSVKDRAALAMIEQAEKNGRLSEGSVIIEPTSGNTGIGLCYIAAIKGYKVIIVMPESMSEERKKLMRSLGAELVLTPASEGIGGSIAKAKELAMETEKSFIPDQFNNPANPDVHKTTTAVEILRDTYGHVDFFVSGVGSGGTITGVGETLKAYNSKIKIIAVEPKDSPVLSGGAASPHKIQGIGAGFVPPLYKNELVDEIITVSTEEAFECARLAAKSEGLLVGISSGAALFASAQIAKREKMQHKTIVTLLPDTGERYLSTELFNQ